MVGTWFTRPSFFWAYLCWECYRMVTSWILNSFHNWWSWWTIRKQGVHLLSLATSWPTFFVPREGNWIVDCQVNLVKNSVGINSLSTAEFPAATMASCALDLMGWLFKICCFCHLILICFWFIFFVFFGGWGGFGYVLPTTSSSNVSDGEYDLSIWLPATTISLLIYFVLGQKGTAKVFLFVGARTIEHLLNQCLVLCILGTFLFNAVK